MSDDLVSRLRAPSFTVPAELSAQDKLMALIRGLEALCAESAAEIERQNKRLDLLAVGFGVPDGGRYIADWQTRIKKYQDQAAEIERLRNEADKYCAWWREERDKRIALRARVREVVGGMLSHSCVADAGPDCKDEEDEAVERAARQLMEDLK